MSNDPEAARLDQTDLIGRILKMVSYTIREGDLGMDVPVAGENTARATSSRATRMARPF